MKRNWLQSQFKCVLILFKVLSLKKNSIEESKFRKSNLKRFLYFWRRVVTFSKPVLLGSPIQDTMYPTKRIINRINRHENSDLPFGRNESEGKQRPGTPECDPGQPQIVSLDNKPGAAVVSRSTPSRPPSLPRPPLAGEGKAPVTTRGSTRREKELVNNSASFDRFAERREGRAWAIHGVQSQGRALFPPVLRGHRRRQASDLVCLGVAFTRD